MKYEAFKTHKMTVLMTLKSVVWSQDQTKERKNLQMLMEQKNHPYDSIVQFAYDKSSTQFKDDDENKVRIT